MSTKAEKDKAWLESIAAAQEKKNQSREVTQSLPKTGTRLEMINRMQEGVSVPLNCDLIDVSRFANRIAANFETKPYFELRELIREKGGNVQPIKVRPKAGGRYEVVYGHRRLQACKDLGLDVLAVIQAMDDLSLWRDMIEENEGRKDLSPYEYAMQYQHALNEGLFKNWTEISKALGHKAHTSILRYKALAGLPIEVVDAFPSPLEIALRDAQDISRALELNREAILEKASLLAKSKPKKSEVLKELLSIAKKDVSMATWIGGSIKDTPKKLVIEINKSKATQDQITQITDFVRRLIN